MRSGVYLITCLVSGKVYVGSSTDIDKRWATHKDLLTRSKHHCRHLQSSWVKYGPCNFVMEMLEETKEGLRDREQFYIDAARGRDLMNGSLSAYRPVLNEKGLERLSASGLQAWKSEERRTNQSAKLKETWARSPERRQALSNHNKKFWTSEQRSIQGYTLRQGWTEERRQAMRDRPRVGGRLI